MAEHTTGPGRSRVDAGDGQVVGLGAAAGEHDLPRPGAEARGDDVAGLVERLAGLPGHGVGARRVAEPLGQERQHGLDRLGPHRRGGGVVEVGGHRSQGRRGPRANGLSG